MALSKKHKIFVEEYLQCFNKTEAYQRVYKPSSRTVAATLGSRLFGNVEILAAISERLRESAMLADEVMFRLAAIARGDIGDFLDDAGNIDIAKARAAQRLGLLKKFKTRTSTQDDGEVTITDTEIELYDALSALGQIGRHHRLFLDRLDLSSSEQVVPIAIVKMSMDEL